MEEFQKRMRKLLEPQRKMQEQMNKYLAPHYQLEEQTKKLLEPQRQLQEQISKYLAPRHQIEEQIKKLLEPQRQMQEQINKYFPPQYQFEEQVKKLLEPQRMLQEQASKYLISINDYLSDPLVATVGVDQSGYLTVGDETVSVETIQEHFAELTVQHQLEEPFFNAFFEWLHKLAPVVRAAVLYLILPYIVSIVANLSTPYYEEWWKSIRDMEPRTAKKEIVNLATENYDAQYLREYRFVVAKVLIVQESNRQKSRILDELYLGKIVKLLE